MQMIGLYFSHVSTVTQVGALMFGSMYFIFIKYQQCCQVSNAGTYVCLCVCVCVLWHDHFNCFLLPAESTLNTYCLINNASLYKRLLLFMYNHNENKQENKCCFLLFEFLFHEQIKRVTKIN